MTESVVLPRNVSELVGSERATAEVGGTMVRRFSVGAKLVFEYNSAAEAKQAHERMAWLSEYVPSPEIVALLGSWLITERPPGECADKPDSHPQPGRLASDIAAALGRIHAIGVERCPFRRTWDDYASDIASVVESGRLDPAVFPDPYCRYPAAELQQMFLDGQAPVEDLVVAHGAPLVSDFFFDGDELSGVLAGNVLGVAERNADLAWLHRSIRESYGDEAVFAFYESYGPGENLIAVDNYFLASFLLA